uniref:Uncharacterized protein n=1 Tax=Panagrolaimus sp. PS1159 TaxID=55785 RepID=A0AC35FYS0_9BILA
MLPFLFSQPDELSQLCLVNLDTITVKVTNECGKLATASFIDNRGIYDLKLQMNVATASFIDNRGIYDPNNLIKDDEIKYYLVYEIFKVKNSTTIDENGYLIAGMKNENGSAVLKIEALRNY